MSYKRQGTFSPSDDLPTLAEKLMREFTAIERAHAQPTTVVVGGTVTRGGGSSGGGPSSGITVRTLDGTLTLLISEFVVDTNTVRLLLSAISGSSVKLAFSPDPELSGVQLSGRIQQDALAALPSTPAADKNIIYLRKIAGTPNEVRLCALDAAGNETIIASYLI